MTRMRLGARDLISTYIDPGSLESWDEPIDRAVDLLAAGIVHAVGPEDPPAHLDPAGFARRMAAECVRQIAAQD